VGAGSFKKHRFALLVRRAEGRRAGRIGADAFAAIASTSTRSSGRASEEITSSVEAGRWLPRYCARTWANFGKFSNRVRNEVIFTTSPMPMPASASTARMFCHTTSVCSSMVAGTDPSGRTPIWPATWSQRALGGASMPCEYVPIGAATDFGLWTLSMGFPVLKDACCLPHGFYPRSVASCSVGGLPLDPR